MTTELLEKIYNSMAIKSKTYDENTAYLKGKNTEIFREAKKASPDNRLGNTFAKMVVDDMCGYAGRKEDIKIEFEVIDVDENSDDTTNEEEYKKIARRWMDYNSDGIETAEMYRETLGQGYAVELWWTSESDEAGLPVKPEYKMVRGDSVYIKWSNTIKPVKEYAIYFNKEKIFEDDKETVSALIMYPHYNETWTKDNDKWAIKITEEEVEGEIVQKAMQETPFSIVPIVYTRANKDEEPIFNSEKCYIDNIDKITSKSLNEIDRFNALILLLPGIADAGLKQKLIESKLFDDLDKYARDPSYLAKDLQGVTEFYKWLEELMEQLFRKSIKIPDMTSQDFAGNAEAAKALLFKLLGMEWVAAQVETYFIQGIYDRKILFDDVIKAGTLSIDTDSITIEVKTKRNIPIDEKEKVELAVMLKGIGVSEETIFKMLPTSIIPDYEKELARKEEEGLKKVNLITDNQAVDTNTDNETA
jgi:SPP1 family phage portal protein